MTKIKGVFELGVTAMAVLIMLAFIAKPIIDDVITPAVDSGGWSTGAAALWMMHEVVLIGGAFLLLIALGAGIYYK